jgi:hypothetical protein
MPNCNTACCFYGFETWSATLRNEHRLRVFENSVMRRRECQRTGGDLVSSSNISQVIRPRKMRWGACSRYGGEERCIEGCVGEI